MHVKYLNMLHTKNINIYKFEYFDVYKLINVVKLCKICSKCFKAYKDMYIL